MLPLPLFAAWGEEDRVTAVLFRWNDKLWDKGTKYTVLRDHRETDEPFSKCAVFLNLFLLFSLILLSPAL